jgi:methionyl-tRNA synthetase
MPSRTLVTSALPYANGHVHVGHLAGAYLPPDIYVRYLRARGEEVLFVSGSDEHGVPITLRARQEGKTPNEVIDVFHPANAEAFARAGVAFDAYGRTSWPLHVEFTHKFFRRLFDEGHIVKKSIQQFYSEKSKMFLPDRYVVGTCPNADCGNPGARGDQCDKCTRTYEAHELVDPRTNLPDDDSTPVLRDTDHWFLKLADFSDALSAWLDGRESWRNNALNTAREWLKQGLHERCITRDTDWGVPIPLDDPDAPGKRIYVWFDAPIGYITNTAQYCRDAGDPEGWRRWWCDAETRLLHFIGKDNIPFHAVIFPAMLHGQGDHILPDNVVANEYLNFKGMKISKSDGTMVELSAILDCVPADPLRYYLTAIAPEGKDTDFFWEDLQARNNGELADTLGNFVNRGFKFAEKYFENRVPAAGERTDEDHAILTAASTAAAEVGALLDGFRMKQALERLMEFARACNVYIDRTAPWKTRKTDPAATARTIRVCLELNAALCGLMRPFLPFSADKVKDAFGEAGTVDPVVGENGYWSAIGETPLNEGAALGQAVPLFPKIDDEQLAEIAARFEKKD